MFKLVLEKSEEPEIKLATSAGSWKKEESSRKTSISALLTKKKKKKAKEFYCVDNNKKQYNHIGKKSKVTLTPHRCVGPPLHWGDDSQRSW